MISKRKIEAALKRKGIQAERIEYMRGCPTPSGYASGWDIELTEEVEMKILDADFMGEILDEFDTTEDALSWIETLPSLSSS